MMLNFIIKRSPIFGVTLMIFISLPTAMKTMSVYHNYVILQSTVTTRGLHVRVDKHSAYIESALHLYVDNASL